MAGNYIIEGEYPFNAYRNGDALTGAAANGKPVVITPIYLDGTQVGQLCFGYDSAREIGYAVGLTDNEELEEQVRALRDENVHLRHVIGLQRKLAIEAINEFTGGSAD